MLSRFVHRLRSCRFQELPEVEAYRGLDSPLRMVPAALPLFAYSMESVGLGIGPFLDFPWPGLFPWEQGSMWPWLQSFRSVEV